MTGVGRPLALAVLVVLAGCGGLAGGGDGTPTRTVTPVPVPTTEPTPTPTPRRVAPGVTDEGVTPSTLARAHARRLRSASFSVLHTRTVIANGSVQSRQVTTGEFGAGYRRYRVDVVRSGRAVPDSRIRYQYDGRRVTRETTRGNATTTQVVVDRGGAGAPSSEPVAVLPFDPAFDGRIAGLLAAADTVDVDPQAPHNLFADKLTLVRAAGFPPGRPEPGVRNASLRALVDPDGLVRLYELRYEAVRDGTRVTVVERLRYTIVEESGNATGTPARNPSRHD